MSLDFIDSFLDNARENNTCRTLRGIEPLNARECLVEGNRCLNFSANNYLGLADHPLLKQRAIEWTEHFGTGSTASRLVCGTLPEYLELEQQIADWKGTEAALLIGSGYMANTGVIPTLLTRKSVVIADKLNHASLNAGCKLSGAKFLRYRHNDVDHLESMLIKSKDAERRLVVVDTVFSMDGDIAPVDEIVELAKKYDAMLFIDDAHGTGLFGDRGQGIIPSIKPDIVMGTFSKAMGSYGAYIACSQKMRDYLVNRCGSFIYTTALPPSTCGAISAAVELVQTVEMRTSCSLFQKRLKYVVDCLKTMGYETGETQTPIIPVILGESDVVVKASKWLLDRGILAVAIRPPTVPQGSARLRLSLNAAHSDDDIEKLLAAFRDLNVLYLSLS